jgi:glutaminyl-peptide cyclotransferase
MPGISQVGVVTRRWSSWILKRLRLKRFTRDMFRAIRAPGIPRVRPRIIRVLPHDPLAHTQGLAYIHGHLYESTGLVGHSTLRRLNTASGAVEENHPVPELWAEGIAVRYDRLVQLTYTEGIGIVYRLPDLEIDGTFRYQGEGWGLAASEDGYVMSDGSHILTFRDPEFKTVGRLAVHLAKRPLESLNDLECAHGRIYAHVLSHNDIYEIAPQTGAVLRIIDCAEIVDRARVGSSALDLNGIAFAPDRNSFFITGKKWPMLFELQWSP